MVVLVVILVVEFGRTLGAVSLEVVLVDDPVLQVGLPLPGRILYRVGSSFLRVY